MAPSPPQPLPDDLIPGILLRLPPDDPAGLVRASAVYKAWRRIISDPAFHGRYRALHPTAPVLGFLHRPRNPKLPRFVSTTSFRPAAADHRQHPLDCRGAATAAPSSTTTAPSAATSSGTRPPASGTKSAMSSAPTTCHSQLCSALRAKAATTAAAAGALSLSPLLAWGPWILVTMTMSWRRRAGISLHVP
ncbi:hypothetical protein BDA96_06G087600 [Sorghum bicolor]|uniref:F-box domain-containing protein n=1 Tax=Sorghum bicolor TaxID=4558 RepID=A0A921UCS2_SORBI|nr:hypothetical protein BDA96_06G087600 [Sorghum bicolor]